MNECEKTVVDVRNGLLIQMRLHWVDMFRGLALMLVLVDHLDMFTGGHSVISDWTLMGLGYSDAAEVFAFLSGVSFGFVYDARMAERGFWDCQWKSMRRTVWIYLAYVTLGLLTLSLVPYAFVLGDGSWKSRMDLFAFHYQPIGLGILAMYVAIVPWLPLWLVIYRRSPWLAVLLSLGLYGMTHFASDWLRHFAVGNVWSFNPLGWQLLIVVGAVLGIRLRQGKRTVPNSIVLFALSVVVILLAMIYAKSTLLGINENMVWTELLQRYSGTMRWLQDKTDLGWLRIIHFASLAYLTYYLLSRCKIDWTHRCLQPFLACGRHPLLTYSVGHLLNCSVILLFGYPMTDHWMKIMIALDLCFLEALIVGCYDRRSAKQHLYTTAN